MIPIFFNLILPFNKTKTLENEEHNPNLFSYIKQKRKHLPKIAVLITSRIDRQIEFKK